MKREISPEEYALGAQLRMEFAQLKKLVETKSQGYYFPLDKYYHLLALETLGIPFGVYTREQELEYIAGSGYLPPYLKPVVVPLHELVLAPLPEVETNISGAISVPSPAGTSPSAKKRQEAVPSLESLCKGQDDEQRREKAAKIDEMWESVRSDTHEANYSAACVAVYKLAVHFGMLHETKARVWKEMLLERYGVSITEGISKYSISNPPVSNVFRNAVVKAFEFAQKNNALLAKRNPLPAIYQ